MKIGNVLSNFLLKNIRDVTTMTNVYDTEFPEIYWKKVRLEMNLKILQKILIRETILCQIPAP